MLKRDCARREGLKLRGRASGGSRFELPGQQIESLEAFARLVSGQGEIGAGPVFADASNRDYHLQPTSPCRGAGVRLPGMGSRDYYGAEVPEDGPVDLGCTALSSPS